MNIDVREISASHAGCLRRAIAHWLRAASVTGAIATLVACGGGGGGGGGGSTDVNGGNGGGTGPTAVSPGGVSKCTKSVKTGFSGNVDWVGSPPIAATGGADGGASGGADGSGGASAGGDLGRITNALVIVKDASLNEIGRASSGPSGLVTISPCDYVGAVLVEFHGQSEAKYFDEALREDVNFPTGSVIRVMVSKLSSNVIATTYTDAAVERLNPEAGLKTVQASGGSAAIGTKALEPALVDQRNAETLALLDAHLPGIHRLQSSSSMTRPTVMLNSQNYSTPNLLPDNDRGRYTATLAGIAKSALGFRPNETSPMLTISRQVASDLSDGKLDMLKNGVSVFKNGTEVTYTYDSLWRSMTVGAGTTSSALGDAAMRAKVSPIGRSSIGYGYGVFVTMVLNSDGTVQYTWRDEAGVQGTQALPGTYVDLLAYGGTSIALSSDRKNLRLGANAWVLEPNTAGTSIVWMGRDEYGLVVRDSDGAFWRNSELNSPDKKYWTRLPYSAEFISVHLGFRDKVYGLNTSGQVYVWPRRDSIQGANRVALPANDPVVQVTNHAEYGLVLALTASGKVYWINRDEVMVKAGAVIAMTGGADPLPVYQTPGASPQLIPNLPASPICWISGSYLTTCNGEVYKVRASFDAVGVFRAVTEAALSQECRSWATAITGLDRVAVPAGIKIWRTTTQKAPQYRGSPCLGFETYSGEVPVFYSEAGQAYELSAPDAIPGSQAYLAVVELTRNVTTPKPANCGGAPDESVLHFGICGNTRLISDFGGTWSGTGWVTAATGARVNGSCRATFDAASGLATVVAPDGQSWSARFNADQFDEVAYTRNPIWGDLKIVRMTNNPLSRDGPDIVFTTSQAINSALGRMRISAAIEYPTRADESARLVAQCQDAVR